MPAILATVPYDGPCQCPVDIVATDRAIHSAYAGTKRPGYAERHRISRMIHCADVPLAIPALRKILRHAREAQQRRIRELRSWAAAPVATASYYDDSGTTASGTHYTLGFASLMYGSEWGRAVSFCAASTTGCAGPVVTGQLDDHGPYVSGRAFDLNEALRIALGCSDLCSVRYRTR